MFNPMFTTEYLNKLGKEYFPGLVGIKIIHIEEGKLIAELPIKKTLFAPNGFLHAGSIVTLGDTAAGYSAIANLPEKAKSFTTLELRCNFMGAIKEGTLECECQAEHLGKTTQVWSVIVKNQQTGKKIATFSCTQLILY